MPLKLRPTGLGSGIDKDRPDYAVYMGEWCVGRIYETRGGPQAYKWFWSMTVNPPMARSDRVATLEEAKAQFQKSWDAWRAWAKLAERWPPPCPRLPRPIHRKGSHRPNPPPSAPSSSIPLGPRPPLHSFTNVSWSK